MTPSSSWQWINKEGELSLDLGEGQSCALQFPAKNVSASAEASPFTLEQTDTFYRFAEKLEHCPVALSESQRLHIVLHAVAATQFHKPVPIKSWLCERAEHLSCQVDDVCLIQSQSHQGLIMVLVRNEKSALVMLLSKGFVTNTQKKLPAFTVLNLCLSNLMPVITSSEHKKSA